MDEVIAGGLPIADGSVKVPEGRGLVAEPGREALAILHRHYLDGGVTKRTNEIEMQKDRTGLEV